MRISGTPPLPRQLTQMELARTIRPSFWSRNSPDDVHAFGKKYVDTGQFCFQRALC